MEKPFLDNYSGQTTDELIAMKEEFRIDSLVLAFEQAIQDKPESELSEPERYILAIEAMEREVNNGGWDQFFFNTDDKFNGILPHALDAINCPVTAKLAREAIDTYQLKTSLDELDERYYELDEPIDDRLFDYIEKNVAEITLT